MEKMQFSRQINSGEHFRARSDLEAGGWGRRVGNECLIELGRESSGEAAGQVFKSRSCWVFYTVLRLEFNSVGIAGRSFWQHIEDVRGGQDWRHGNHGNNCGSKSLIHSPNCTLESPGELLDTPVSGLQPTTLSPQNNCPANSWTSPGDSNM